MTTDTQLAPTDAELDELRQANSGKLNFVTFSEFRTIARAVLAKWGTPPTVAGEPVFAFRRKGFDDFCTCTEERYAELSAKPNLFETRIFYTTPPAQADSQPAPVREEEREAFKAAHRHLELDEVPDAWGRPMFKYSHVEASWLGWIARASHGQAQAAPQTSPAAQGDALPREEFAWLVVREACETEPADEDDPECIRILRRDLKSSVLAAFLRHDAARAAQEGKSHDN